MSAAVHHTAANHDAGITVPARARLGDNLHAAAARRINRLAPEDRPAALEAMPSGEGLAAFLEMRPEAQESLLSHMDRGRACRLANRLPFNTLARVLEHLPETTREEIVGNLRPLKRRRVETVLSSQVQ